VTDYKKIQYINHLKDDNLDYTFLTDLDYDSSEILFEYCNLSNDKNKKYEFKNELNYTIYFIYIKSYLYKNW